jgi:GT2 family glycosyltransferase
MPNHPLLTISIVSHQHGDLIHDLLDDLQLLGIEYVEVILTLNVAEKLPFDCNIYDFPIHLRFNTQPKGFSANHNAAFLLKKGKWFCVLNPDIRLKTDPFPNLLECLQDDRVAVAAPAIVDRHGNIEDSARRLPSPMRVVKKAFQRKFRQEYGLDSRIIMPDWVAGMFMLFSSDCFERIGGFNEKYFLYYEDVDICTRFRLAGYKIVLCTGVSAIHDARRESHRKIKNFLAHLRSFFRFFLSSVYLQALILNLRTKK